MVGVLDYYRKAGLTEATPIKHGSAEVRLVKIGPDEANFMNLRAALNKTPEQCITQGEYVQLFINGWLWMTDTDMERRTNKEFIDYARGKVLIGGLGIGLLLVNLVPKLESGEVTEITVLENNSDVISLVSKVLKDLIIDKYNIRIIEADVNSWIDEIDMEVERFDTIYFDIWDSISSDIIYEGKDLMGRYSMILNEKRGDYINCWAYDLAERRNEW